MLVQQALGVVAVHRLAHGDEVLLGHQLADGLTRFGGEAHVAVGDDADEAPRAALEHGDAGDVVVGHQPQRVGQRLVGMDGDGVDHHPRLELLDLAHLVRLLGDAEIAMDDADPARLRHGDGEGAFGHGVHGGGDDGAAERYFARQARMRVGLGR